MELAYILVIIVALAIAAAAMIRGSYYKRSDQASDGYIKILKKNRDRAEKEIYDLREQLYKAQKENRVLRNVVNWLLN